MTMIKYQKNSYPKKSKRNLDYNQLSPVEVYKLVYTGKIKNFPKGTWNQPDSTTYAAEIIRFLIEDILHWSDEDIKKYYSAKILFKHHLQGMLQHCFEKNRYKALNAAYPGKYKEWDLLQSSVGYWTNENIAGATKWLIEEKLQWTELEVRQKLSSSIFIDNGLHRLLSRVKGNPIRAIQLTYPGRFDDLAINKDVLNIWISNLDVKKNSHNFWTLETAIKAVKFLIEEKLQWTDEDIKKNLSEKTFVDNGLRRPFKVFFHSSPFQVIDAVYPGRFKAWELPKVPQNFWTLENGIQAVKWLIEEKLQWNDEDIKNQYSQKIFYEYGLKGVLTSVFHSSPFLALDAAYPGRFNKKDFHSGRNIGPGRFNHDNRYINTDQLSPIEIYQLVLTGKFKKFPNRTWNQPDSIEYAKEVFRYLIEEILKWSDEDIKNNFSAKIFIDYQLKGLLAELFNNSPFKVLDTVYPGRFKEWELKKVPHNYWTENMVILAIKWLIEEKLQWSEEDIKKNFTTKTFIEHGLRRLFDCKLINRSPYQAIQLVYPDRFKEWELPSTSHSFWTPDTSIQAIKWLIEEKLQLSEEDIKKKLTVRVFSDNNLRGLLRCRFNDSPFQAIDAVYPGKFNRQDFRRFNGSSSFN